MKRLTPLSLFVLLALQAACAEDKLPAFPPALGRPDAGPDAGDGGALGDNQNAIGGSTMGELVDNLKAWGADIGDPDKICAGQHHSCAINKQGLAQCWGKEADGSATPPQNLPKLVQITCGEAHTCALGDDGSIACWGLGTKKDLIGTSPLEQGQSIVPSGKYKEVSARGSFTCAIDISDAVVCWGAGSATSTPDFPNFGQASPPKGAYKGISAGEVHACAIKLATSEVVCWGNGGDGVDCFPPMHYDCGQSMTPPGKFLEVASGEEHSCALREDGTIACWGRGTAKSNGVSMTGTECDISAADSSYACGQAHPPDDPMKNFARLRSGWLYSCAITDEYALQCWGWDDNGITSVPKGKFSQVSAGGDTHACAIRTDGAVVCWGRGAGSEGVPADFPGK
jgi:alpha-tubulin suppressor-like RCC1 family protein